MPAPVKPSGSLRARITVPALLTATGPIGSPTAAAPPAQPPPHATPQPGTPARRPHHLAALWSGPF